MLPVARAVSRSAENQADFALGGVGILAALAAAALLRRTGLIVDQHGHALGPADVALDGDQIRQRQVHPPAQPAQHRRALPGRLADIRAESGVLSVRAMNDSDAIAALERAIAFCQATLSYGAAQEMPPMPERQFIRPAEVNYFVDVEVAP